MSGEKLYHQTTRTFERKILTQSKSPIPPLKKRSAPCCNLAREQRRISLKMHNHVTVFDEISKFTLYYQH